MEGGEGTKQLIGFLLDNGKKHHGKRRPKDKNSKTILDRGGYEDEKANSIKHSFRSVIRVGC